MAATLTDGTWRGVWPDGKCLNSLGFVAWHHSWTDGTRPSSPVTTSNSTLSSSPTGIDSREDLQHECMRCGACDEVIDKFGYARGLVKHSTRNAVTSGWDKAQVVRPALHPRVLADSTVLLAIDVAVGVSLFLRVPMKVDVIRDRGALARMVEQGRIETVYRLQIMNATEDKQAAIRRDEKTTFLVPH